MIRFPICAQCVSTYLFATVRSVVLLAWDGVLDLSDMRGLYLVRTFRAMIDELLANVCGCSCVGSIITLSICSMQCRFNFE